MTVHATSTHTPHTQDLEVHDAVRKAVMESEARNQTRINEAVRKAYEDANFQAEQVRLEAVTNVANAVGELAGPLIAVLDVLPNCYPTALPSLSPESPLQRFQRPPPCITTRHT